MRINTSQYQDKFNIKTTWVVNVADQCREPPLRDVDWAPLAGKPVEKPVERSKAAFVIEMVFSLEKCVDFI